MFTHFPDDGSVNSCTLLTSEWLTCKRVNFEGNYQKTYQLGIHYLQPKQACIFLPYS